MNPRLFSFAIAILFCVLSSTAIQGQAFGTVSSAVSLANCNQSDYFNVTGSGANLIGPAENVFTTTNLGVYTHNSGTLILRGGELRTFKNAGLVNVCTARMHYRVYLQSAAPGAFTSINLPRVDNCDVPSSQYPSGGSCTAGDQKWNRVIPDVNLTSFAPGNYILEIYYDITGSSTSASLCNETVTLNDGGNNYKAFFSIQSPVLASNNPTTCGGTEGYITVSGLIPAALYEVSYTDDGLPVGPLNLTANGTGQIIIGGLNAGVYSDFELLINGCSTDLFTGIILSNPVFTPTFTKIAAFCAGTIQPVLPTVSNNGITGTWSPATVNNQQSGSYTFTPTGGQCGLNAVMNVTVIPRVTPTFIFGTTLTICAGGTVPTLPNISTNGITGTWNPAVVSNQNSGTYNFTAAPGQCVNNTSFTVIITPNVTPLFNLGTALSICAGAAVPSLPAASDNAITGTWNPASIDNQNSATYTFTPTAGLCAVPATLDVTVNPNITPTFSFGTAMTICADANVSALPAASNEGITGTWNPAIIDNSTSGTYTFTPDAGLCATTATLAITVAQNIVPTFSFGQSLTICAGTTVPSLHGSSTNGIPGTWNPSAVDPNNSGVYVFTPDPGFCAIPATFTVIINPSVTPTFSFGASLTICANGTVPTLTNASTNAVTGTWSPATVDNQNSGVYTFTPTPGLCALPVTFTVTVNPNITPVFNFGTSLTICGNGTVPALPTMSDNGITGVWSPTSANNQNSGVYTFTPTAGLCALPTTFTVTVNPNITPSFVFGESLTICAGDTVPSLPAISSNGITGTWNPAGVDDQTSMVYTFTPTAGLCAIPATYTVTVNPIVTPTFSFGTSLAICASGTVPPLPATSSNGINGTWNPAVANNQSSGTYTFTPAFGLCAIPTTFTITVGTNITPVFSFGTSLTICAGAVIPTLVTTSDNGITGTWNPATVNNQASGTYTFTPAAGACTLPTTFTVTVTPNITPTFTFGTTLSVCAGSTVPALATTSVNGITGTWTPSVIDNQNSGVYTFTPDAGLCALPTNLTVTVNQIIAPAFSFGTAITICSASTPPDLPAISTNGINGTWNPAVISTQASAVYTFTPTAGQCALPTTLTVTITPTVIPVFSFGGSLIICTGGTAPSLPLTSTNGIDGVWNPAVVSNQASGVYTFTPTATPEQCIATVTFMVTVKPILTPAFDFGTAQTICTAATVPQLPVTSTNSISGVWTPATVSNQASATYTFKSDPGQCATATATFVVTVNPVATLTSTSSDTAVFDGATIPANNFSGTPVDVVFNWTNSNPAIGLAASGTGNIPSFTATNRGNDPITATITVTPMINGCPGVAQTYSITVKPLNKDVFVPNVFSPNADGKNDILYVYGNYIDRVDMRIFNQWGEQIIMITDKSKGWDGTHRGKAQPVGVYVYVLQAVLSDGRTVKMKGSVTLLR